MVTLQLRLFLTSALIRGKLASCPGRSTPPRPRERTSVTHGPGVQFGPTALPDIWARGGNIACAGNRTLDHPRCSLVVTPPIEYSSHPEDRGSKFFRSAGIIKYYTM
jgi:hypothetical protein